MPHSFPNIGNAAEFVGQTPWSAPWSALEEPRLSTTATGRRGRRPRSRGTAPRIMKAPGYRKRMRHLTPGRAPPQPRPGGGRAGGRLCIVGRYCAGIAGFGTYNKICRTKPFLKTCVEVLLVCNKLRGLVKVLVIMQASRVSGAA